MSKNDQGSHQAQSAAEPSAALGWGRLPVICRSTLAMHQGVDLVSSTGTWTRRVEAHSRHKADLGLNAWCDQRVVDAVSDITAS
jgi:hypothetical protein